MSPQLAEKPFSDDAPKTELRQDKLSVGPFAKRLADILIRLPAPNGYVVGLHGAWGSGKTSVLNFVRRYVDKHNVEKGEDEEALLWLEFQPWMASGHRDLTSSFFKVLSEQLETRKPGWSQRLKRGRVASDAVFDNLDKLSWLTAHSHGGALPAGIKVAKGGFNSLVDALAEEPSLQKVHARLVKALQESGRKLLVVIDDIDRLRKDEILQMMMMVKTVGQLPNVIYLLAYDQRIVWDALAEGKASSEKMPSYAEKIIQQEVALPVPSADQLLQLFSVETKFLSLPDTARDRAATVASRGLRRWLRTPRDVLRFVNNLRFAWSSVADYLDPVDYIAIEGLRTFDKEAFDFIRDNREFLFPRALALFPRDKDMMEMVRQFRTRVPSGDLRQVTEIVSLLFPHRRAAFDHTAEEKSSGKLKEGYGIEQQQLIRSRRGLGFVDSYDSYFQLYPPPHLASRSTVDSFMAALNNEEALTEALNIAQNLVRQDFMFMTVDFIRDIADRVARPNVFSSSRQPISSIQLLRAVIRVFEIRLRPIPPRFALGSLKALLSAILEDLPKEQATNELVKMFSGELDIGTAAFLTVEVLVGMGAMSGGAQYLRELIGRDNGERLAGVVVDRLEAERAAGTLTQAEPMFGLLQLWEKVRGIEVPRAWVSENIGDRTLLLELASLFVYREDDGPWKAYHRSADHSEDTMRFFDFRALVDAVSVLANADLNVDQRAMVRVWSAGLEGERPDEDSGDDD